MRMSGGEYSFCKVMNCQMNLLKRRRLFRSLKKRKEKSSNKPWLKLKKVMTWCIASTVISYLRAHSAFISLAEK